VQSTPATRHPNLDGITCYSIHNTTNSSLAIEVERKGTAATATGTLEPKLLSARAITVDGRGGRCCTATVHLRPTQAAFGCSCPRKLSEAGVGSHGPVAIDRCCWRQGAVQADKMGLITALALFH